MEKTENPEKSKLKQLKKIRMEKHLSVKLCIGNTMNCLKKSDNYTDISTTSQFMLLIDSIIKNPKELTTLTNEDLANLGFCTSCIMASDFTSKYSQYYIWSTGAVVVSVGFYAFMKQLDNSYLLNSHFPAFIVLIHEGREYFANLIQELILTGKEKLSFYDAFDRIKFWGSEQKKYDIAIHFEYTLQRYCIVKGTSNEYLNDWLQEILHDIKSIEERLKTTDSLPQAKEVYYILSNLLLNNTMPTCCEIN